MELDYAEFFRTLVGTVLLVAWYVISRRTRGRWAHMTRVGKRLWIGYYILLFAVIWATIDSLNADSPITSKNYVLAFAAAFLAIGGLLRLEGDESTEPVYWVNLKGRPSTWRIIKLR